MNAVGCRRRTMLPIKMWGSNLHKIMSHETLLTVSTSGI